MKSTSDRIDRIIVELGVSLPDIEALPIKGNRQLIEARQLIREAQRKLRQVYNELKEKGE